MYLLNLKAKTPEWKRRVITKPPQSRHQHTIVGIEGTSNLQQRYIFGGINTPNNTFFNDTWLIDLSQGINYSDGMAEVSGAKVELIDTKGNKPKERKGHCSFIYNNKMFVYGGQAKDLNYDTMKDINFLDLDTFQWSAFENKSAEISPRSLFSCSWYNDTTIIV